MEYLLRTRNGNIGRLARNIDPRLARNIDPESHTRYIRVLYWGRYSSSSPFHSCRTNWDRNNCVPCSCPVLIARLEANLQGESDASRNDPFPSPPPHFPPAPLEVIPIESPTPTGP